MSILDEIVRRKKERLEEAKRREPIAGLRSRIADMKPALDFAGSIRRAGGRGIGLIAEIKKASPSKGLIRADFDPSAIAAIYGDRADAVSVLTEEDFFQGSLEHLGVAKKASGRAVLRKDFIFDEYQIHESRANGADAILLIARILGRTQAAEYLHMARETGLGALFEVHDAKELETALLIGAPVIGINNRNLDTLAIDIGTSFMLKKEIPADRIVVSESGIEARADVERLEEAGIDAMLVGTAFMKSPDIARAVDELMGKAAGKSVKG